MLKGTGTIHISLSLSPSPSPSLPISPSVSLIVFRLFRVSFFARSAAAAAAAAAAVMAVPGLAPSFTHIHARTQNARAPRTRTLSHTKEHPSAQRAHMRTRTRTHTHTRKDTRKGTGTLASTNPTPTRSLSGLTLTWSLWVPMGPYGSLPVSQWRQCLRLHLLPLRLQQLWRQAQRTLQHPMPPSQRPRLLRPRLKVQPPQLARPLPPTLLQQPPSTPQPALQPWWVSGWVGVGAGYVG